MRLIKWVVSFSNAYGNGCKRNKKKTPTKYNNSARKARTEEREEERQHETAAVEEYISLAACGWRVCPLPRGEMTAGHVSSKSDLHLIHSLAL